nr:venom polypeptide precursor [Doratifera vulnerans]
MYKFVLLASVFALFALLSVEAWTPCIKKGNSCNPDDGRIAGCCYPTYCYKASSSCILPD